jgi:phosphoenolpyruvate carboxylase
MLTYALSMLTYADVCSQRMSESSCAAYRRMVYETPNFVEYFRSITPEQVG